MEKTYSYMDPNHDEGSRNFDRVYYLIKKYFRVEDMKFGYSSGAGHKLFIRGDESLLQEDRTFFELKTGFCFQEELGIPKWLYGDGTAVPKEWTTYTELSIYLNMCNEADLFPNEYA